MEFLNCDEFSMFINENYRWDSSYIRRITVPKYRFASIYANRFGGTFTTNLLSLKEEAFTSIIPPALPAPLRCGIIDESGWPMSFYTPEDCDVIYGDELEKEVSWRGQSDLSHLYGKTIRFKLSLLMRMYFIADKIRQARTEPEAERGIRNGVCKYQGT